MTTQEINELGNYFQNNLICTFISTRNLLFCQSKEQLDEVNCLLEDLGIEHSIRYDFIYRHTLCGSFGAYISFE